MRQLHTLTVTHALTHPRTCRHSPTRKHASACGAETDRPTRADARAAAEIVAQAKLRLGSRKDVSPRLYTHFSLPLSCCLVQQRTEKEWRGAHTRVNSSSSSAELQQTHTHHRGGAVIFADVQLIRQPLPTETAADTAAAT
eukprot:GHVU01110461.1.p1 GENE.GHVU01110461.1~~GHVU01110461.1.p1  ORF type:complete len:141 (+),score=14.72 GHVU01110461.1:65-487(+)